MADVLLEHLLLLVAAMDTTHEHWPGHEKHKYKNVDPQNIPVTECLKDVITRVIPFWEENIVPDLKAGKNVLVAAHGNSIRAICKYLDNIPDDVIPGLEIPTGIPLVYELDENLKPIPSPNATAPLTGAFLVSKEELEKAQAAVANQIAVDPEEEVKPKA